MAEKDEKELGCAVESMLTSANPARPEMPAEKTKPIVRYHQTVTPRLSASVSFSSMEENSGRKRCVTPNAINAATMPVTTVTSTIVGADQSCTPKKVAGDRPAIPSEPPV